jgi:HlyD family secretion protein
VEGKHEALRPEMTATVEIEVKRADNAMSVPAQAVVHRRLKDLPDTPLFRDWVALQPKTPSEKGKDDAVRYLKVVFLMENSVAVARPVKTGINDSERIEILSGIKPDANVIVGPFRALDEMKDGQPVKLEDEKSKSKKKESKKAKGKP